MEKNLPLIIRGKLLEKLSSNHELLFEHSKILIPKLDYFDIENIMEGSHLNYDNLNINQIINFLYTVGQRWKSEEYSRRRAYIRSLINYLGYSPQMAKLEANWIAM
ncbi:acyl-CoA reductase, partial [Vibrio vulnificus]